MSTLGVVLSMVGAVGGFALLFVFARTLMRRRLERETGHPADGPWPRGRRLRDMTPLAMTMGVVAVALAVAGVVARALDSLWTFAFFGGTIIAAIVVAVDETRRLKRQGLER